MLTLNSGLINEENKIECKYYEIEQNCKKLTEAFCLESEENQKIFQEFAKNYHTFRPYFDFVVCYLNYKVLNPQMEENTMLVGKNNHMYFYKVECSEYENNFRYGLSDDKTLEVYPMMLDTSTFHDCLIDGKGNHIFPYQMLGHEHIFQQILNMLLISNKDICEDYQNYHSDIGMFVQRYLPILRFQADKEGRMMVVRGVYRSDNITYTQQSFIDGLFDNHYSYPFYWYDASTFDQYEFARDLSKQLEYKEGGKNDSRRL